MVFKNDLKSGYIYDYFLKVLARIFDKAFLHLKLSLKAWVNGLAGEAFHGAVAFHGMGH